MVDQGWDITVEVLRLELANVHGLANAVTAPGCVELPFAELHQLVVWVERTKENFRIGR